MWLGWMMSCFLGGGDDTGLLDAAPACSAEGALRGAVNATFPETVTCLGSGSSGIAGEGIDFSNGGTVSTDRLSLSIELVNWIPGADGETIDALPTLVDVVDRDAGTTWRSLDPSDADPAGCAFTGSVELAGPFEQAYLSGDVTCSRDLTEAGGSTVVLDGAVSVTGLGPVP